MTRSEGAPSRTTGANRRERVSDAMVTCPKTHGLGASVEEIRRLFDNDHVHLALVVHPGGRLVTCIERADLDVDAGHRAPAVTDIGTLAGRTVSPDAVLAPVMAGMVREGRRRLAVVDAEGRLLGLLCLKRSGTGFCSDDGVMSRAQERGDPVPPPLPLRPD